ncbi:glycoside hydrolase family 16 protein [Rhodocytophaga rosea]|uniref:Glycoside hydrolase family 16 protein n=1 Tax=Rhodocytophaga rosea TaxID=2704465 RepID=A0A6C0GV31_9BACT|nr:glycoside hydrolase family 16 protein [Rhodocytophaga rosea]QHT71674.1 glycoside hydrolase family 16 protein [Rhodocytophaga rosea]
MKPHSLINYNRNHGFSMVETAKQLTYFLADKRLYLAVVFCLLSVGCTQNKEFPEPGTTKAIPHRIAPVITKCGSVLDEASLINKGWNILFEDNFGKGGILLPPGAPNPTLDETKWTYWTSGAYNNELQYYQPANLTLGNSDVAGNLDLMITAKEEHIEDGAISPYAGPTEVGDFEYTSGRIESIQTFRGSDYNKVRIYARIKLPTAYGLWPAFWTLGVDGPNEQWPQNGEIDIMESKVDVLGNVPTEYQTNYFYGTSPGNNLVSGAEFEVGVADLTSCYHIFMVEWREEELKYYFDELLIDTKTYDPDPLSSGHYIPELWDKEQRIVLSLAYGGDFLGNNFVPGAIAAGTGTMYVDWVKVFVK